MFEDIIYHFGYNPNKVVDWTPQFVGLTSTDISLSGTYAKNGVFVIFSALITVGSGSTSSVQGSTFINNLPLKAEDYGHAAVYNITSKALIGSAMIDKNTNNIYMPTWTSVTHSVAITGVYRTVLNKRNT
jgi:hypothetical protein